MPSSPAAPCGIPGCPELVIGGGRCAKHEAQANRGYNQRRGPWERMYHAPTWKKLRASQLVIEPTCRRCGAPATDVDHIVPFRPDVGGSFTDPANLQSLCSRCHDRKSGIDRRSRGAKGGVLTLVAGPPCSGKTTYVRSHASPGEAVLDFDDLYEELTGERYGHGATDYRRVQAEFFARLRTLRQGGKPAWIIAGVPKRWRRRRYRAQYGVAKVVVLEVPAETCIERAQGTRPEGWADHIRRWWREYEPDPSDIVIRSNNGLAGTVISDTRQAVSRGGGRPVPTKERNPLTSTDAEAGGSGA